MQLTESQKETLTNLELLFKSLNAQKSFGKFNLIDVSEFNAKVAEDEKIIAEYKAATDAFNAMVHEHFQTLAEQLQEDLPTLSVSYEDDVLSIRVNIQTQVRSLCFWWNVNNKAVKLNNGQVIEKPTSFYYKYKTESYKDVNKIFEEKSFKEHLLKLLTAAKNK